MLGSALNSNPSQSVCPPSSHQPQQQPQQQPQPQQLPPSPPATAITASSRLGPDSSRSTSTSNTTAAAAAPSTPSSSSDRTTTPTSSSAAPPSSSASAAALGSAPLPSHPLRHHVPAYISRQHSSASTSTSSSSPSSSVQPSAATRAFSSSLSTTPAVATASHPPTSSMNPSSSVAAFSHGHHHPAHPSQHLRRSSNHTFASSRPGSHSSPASSQLQPTTHSLRPLGGSEATSPSRIKVRDLSHVQSFANEEFHAQSQRGSSQAPGQWSQERQYEISSMPVTDIIEMVAGLLTKITTTNDVHHESVHRHIPPPDSTANLSPQATSVLAFHGKNVPGISILNYLTRIHKYCPTTYEVFISLLIYFDRMTEMVNKGHLDRVRQRLSGCGPEQTERNNNNNRSDTNTTTTSSEHPSSGPRTARPSYASPMVTPPSSTGMTAQDPASPSSISPSLRPQEEGEAFAQFFVVDSFNIHRLVIAGVTCASKFFSDVFYTNSRYAKVLFRLSCSFFCPLNAHHLGQVGGLPLVELNHLELQFLLLNDFRLSIPVEELEAYGTMLVEFYAREVVSQQQSSASASIPRPINPSIAAGRQPEVRQTPTPP